MRFTCLSLLAAVLSFGCASKPEEEKSPFVGKSSVINTPSSGEKTDRKDKEDKPHVAPSHEISGKVVLVNDTLRYVVVDFGFGRLPQPEQRLAVYRKNNKVAEIKISSHSRNSNFAADIVTGTVQMGDEVRM